MWNPPRHDGPAGDAGLALVAEEQEGVASARQMAALGIGDDAVLRRAAAGRLHRIHQGVYAVGHAHLSPRGRLFAAVLACGPAAVASHRSAAWVHELLALGSSIHDITTPGRRRRPGIRLHRSSLHPSDVTEVRGIPVTTVARTLLDLAETAPARRVEQAMDQAAHLRTLSLAALDEVMARANGRRGLKTLREVRKTHAPGTTGTRSELEERFLALVRRAGLSMPLLNQRIGDYQADVHWPAARLIVELDGGTHLTRKTARRDRRRDAQLLIAGWLTVRYTWEDIVHDPRTAVAELTVLLARIGSVNVGAPYHLAPCPR